VENVWYHKQFVMIKFGGIDDMNAAETLRGAEIKIDDSEALPLGEDEYYIRDLLGLRVVTDEGETLGELSDVLQTGANDVYVVKNKNDGQVLIPAIAQCVLDVDIGARAMTVHLLEGLR
jgi:16S rRNA processing protein RimM